MSRESKATKEEIQRNRDEAYQNGWGDGYAEGFGKATEAAEARAERLEAALRLLHDNVVLAFPALANLGPVANARAALTTEERK